MGDAEALEVARLLEPHRRPEVLYEELVVLGSQGVDGEGLVGLDHLVAAPLELGEHRLPEKRADEVVELGARERGLLLVALGLVVEAAEQQLLVEGARHLGLEDRVVVGRGRGSISRSSTSASSARPRGRE